jgi:hypothetical protein
MIQLLKNWHWLHSWTKWVSGPTVLVSYPWTEPGHYAHTQTKQTRECVVCGVVEERIF